LGIKVIAMSDTVGVAKPDTIEYIFSNLVSEFKDIEIGAHFHSTKQIWEEKISTAYQYGCRRFDSAMNGIGGCPMAKDELVGNIATENIVDWAGKNKILLDLNTEAYKQAVLMASQIFI